MSENDVPLDNMSIESSRQFMTSLSFSVDVGNANKALNANYLRLISLQGQEQVSESYQFTLALRADAHNYTWDDTYVPDDAFSDLPDLEGPAEPLPLVTGRAEAMIGQWARVKIGYSATFKPDAGVPVPPNPNIPLPARYFQGIVSAISMSAPGEYTAELSSPLLRLTHRNRYHVYKSMTIAGVIRELLEPELIRYGEKLKVDYHISGLAASRQQDWLQAGESDYALLQRLMSKAAIHFYFVHQEHSLTLVFSNQPSHRDDVTIPGASAGRVALRYSYTDIKNLGLQQWDLFCNLTYKTQMMPDGVQSILSRHEADWETNAVAKYTSYPEASTSAEMSDYHFYKTFAYGVNKAESTESLCYIEQQIACQQTSLSGESTNYLLSPGYAFTLTQQAIRPSDDGTLNPSSSGVALNEPHYTASNLMLTQFDQQVFVVTKITHKMSENAPYSGSVEASPLPKATQAATSDVLITPFSIQATHQGSVLATVVESAVAQSSYFLEKRDFSTELSATQFGLNESGSSIERNKQIGCVVQFATDVDTDITHWVALSAGSQTAPAVGSMVMIGRGDNESEIPQIQQVLSSHGQKTIQPLLWRNNSWTFNTNWGSSCNTSYGDSLNIHFGSEATPHLSTAMNIVQTAYDNPTVLSAHFGGVNYDKGCSFSYSTTGNGAQGLANASVSQGSHFSESHSEQDYSVSYNNCRQSYSKSNKSVNISYQGPFTDSVDENNLSFINGRIPNQEIIDICNGLPDGSSYNESHVKGSSTSISTLEGLRSDTSAVMGVSQSSSVFGGLKIDASQVGGDCTSVSSFEGTKRDTSVVVGACASDSTFMGVKSDSSVVQGACESDSTFMGAKSDSTLTMGACISDSTFMGAKSDRSVVMGECVSDSTFMGDKSDTVLTIGMCSSINTFMGKKNDTNITSGLCTSTNLMMAGCINTNITTGTQETTNITSGSSITTDITMGNHTGDGINLGDSQEGKGTLGSLTVNTSAGLNLTESTEVGGIKTVNEIVAGVSVRTEEAAAIAHNIEGITAFSIATMNITVDAVLSIM